MSTSHKTAINTLLKHLRSHNEETSLRAAELLLAHDDVPVKALGKEPVKTAPEEPKGPTGDAIARGLLDDIRQQWPQSVYELVLKIYEATGRVPRLETDEADGGAVVTYYIRDKYGEVRTRNRKNSTSAPQDRMKHVLRLALQSARKDHVPE